MDFCYQQFFSFQKVNDLLKSNLAIDGTKGGLILGVSHQQGGIYVLIKYNDGYRLMAEFEGREFLINPGATLYYADKLHELNNSARDKNFDLTHSDNLFGIKTIDCRTDSKIYKSKFILLDARGSQFIVNKYSTSRHLENLNQLNLDVEWKSKRELVDWSTVILSDPFFIPHYPTKNESDQVIKFERKTLFQKIFRR